MRYDYPDECPVFRAQQSGRLFVGCGPGLVDTAIMTDWGDGWSYGYYTCACEPLTISAVLMYEACGGTLADAEEVALSRPGRKPDKLFARAHAYQVLKTEMGLGC